MSDRDSAFADEYRTQRLVDLSQLLNTCLEKRRKGEQVQSTSKYSVGFCDDPGS